MVIRAILIDPFGCTITEGAVDRGDINAFHELLSHPAMPVAEVSQPVLMPDAFGGDVAIVDEDGLNVMVERYWGVDGFSHPLAGKALLVGEPDAEGRLTAARSTVELARRKIGFFSKSPSNLDWRWFPTSVPWSGVTTRQ